MAVYWDTSCALKLYCRESGSEECLRRISASSDPLFSSVLLASEMAFAFHQKEARGELKTGAADLLYEKFTDDVTKGLFQLIPLGDDICREVRHIAKICYTHTPSIPLRTLDGLHLASAKLSRCRQILTTDKRMIAAASLLGLKADF